MQELKQRPWRNVAYWLVSFDLLSYLPYIAQVHLSRDNIAHYGLSSPCITRHTGLVCESRLLPRHRERATIATEVGKVITRLKHVHSQQENMQP